MHKHNVCSCMLEFNQIHTMKQPNLILLNNKYLLHQNYSMAIKSFFVVVHYKSYSTKNVFKKSDNVHKNEVQYIR